jgi:hypothetical protein
MIVALLWNIFSLCWAISCIITFPSIYVVTQIPAFGRATPLTQPLFYFTIQHHSFFDYMSDRVRRIMGFSKNKQEIELGNEPTS